jgi:iron complex transport system substrate-binding protein
VKPVDLLSGAWLLLLLAAVTYVGGAFSARSAAPLSGGSAAPLSGRSAAPAGVAPRAAPPASSIVVDVTGRELPRKHYQRIASASQLADGLLLELAEPERILALSHQGRLHDPDAHRYGKRAEVSGPSDLERLIELGADVLVVNHLGAESELARARSSGIAVFDLGEMRGLRTLQPSILALATLLGDRSRGERLWQRFSRRLRAVSNDIAPTQRKQALYVAIYAGKMYGGTRGTSYNDVLTAAGLIDEAARKYSSWPEYDPEQLLELDPALIVTNSGMASELCGNVWLAGLRACGAGRAQVIEIPADLIGDAGLRMLDAAEELHDRVYGAGHP